MATDRIPLPDLQALSPEQQAVADEVASGPRKEVRGPVRAWLYSPEYASRAQRVGEFLRWGTSLDARISELAILLTARHYTCHYMWFNHEPLARAAGLSPEAVGAIKRNEEPRLERPDEAAAHGFVTETLRRHAVSEKTLTAAREQFGERGTIELGAIVGHYHCGAIALAICDVTLPDGSRACLD